MGEYSRISSDGGRYEGLFQNLGVRFFFGGGGFIGGREETFGKCFFRGRGAWFRKFFLFRIFWRGCIQNNGKN